jgi:hypothetical protein
MIRPRFACMHVITSPHSLIRSSLETLWALQFTDTQIDRNPGDPIHTGFANAG